MKINILGKEYDYQPYKNEMYLDLMRLRLMRNPSFKRVFKRNVTDGFISDMKFVVDPNNRFTENSVWSISGLSGTGKSMVVLSLLKIIVPERFSYKNFCFYDEEILQMAKTLPRDSFIVRDEGTDKGVFGIGSNRQSSSLQLLTETSRKRGLSLAFIEPSEKQSDIVKWYMETVDMDIENRITRVALKEPKTMEYIGAVYVPVVDENDNDWIQYNIKKDKFISDVGQGKLVGAKMNAKDIAMEIYNKIDFEVYKTKKERKAFVINEFPHYTTGEIELILTFLEIINRENGQLDTKEIQD